MSSGIPILSVDGLNEIIRSILPGNKPSNRPRTCAVKSLKHKTWARTRLLLNPSSQCHVGRYQTRLVSCHCDQSMTPRAVPLTEHFTMGQVPAALVNVTRHRNMHPFTLTSSIASVHPALAKRSILQLPAAIPLATPKLLHKRRSPGR